MRINYGFIIRKENGEILAASPVIYPTEREAYRVGQEVLLENISESDPSKITLEESIKCTIEYTEKEVKTKLLLTH